MSVDLDRLDAVATLSKITTETVFFWLEKQIDKKYSFLHTWKEYWALTGKPYIQKDDRMEQLSWFETAVQTQRLYFNDLQGFSLTNEEVMAIPVGGIQKLIRTRAFLRLIVRSRLRSCWARSSMANLVSKISLVGVSRIRVMTLRLNLALWRKSNG